MSDDMESVSASKLKLFMSCKRKYYYRYILKLPTARHPAAVTGTCVHKAVEMFHRSGDDMSMTYQNQWVEEMRNDSALLSDSRVARAQKDGLAMLDLYDCTRQPSAVELEFRLPFPDPISPICYIHGFIDQVFLGESKIEDLKTSRNKPIAGVLGYDPQFILYDWAYLNMYGEMASQIIWRHMRTGEGIAADVRGGNKFDIVLSAVEELLTFNSTARSYAESDKHEELFNQRVGESCMFCDYREACLGRKD